MGLNAQTAVPVFTAGQVLTAEQVTQINTGVPVFASTTTRDAAFGGAGEKTLAQGQFCYLESTSKLQVYTGSAWTNVGTQTNIERFTASTTWTVPTGVTYVKAYILGGGGGIGSAASGAGGTSSFGFAGGTISAAGGPALNLTNTLSAVTVAGPANSGRGAFYAAAGSGSFFGYTGNNQIGDGVYTVAGGATTPGASITVTIGAGGTAGTTGAAGGSGFIYVEYEV